jgi:hypothetical protein
MEKIFNPLALRQGEDLKKPRTGFIPTFAPYANTNRRGETSYITTPFYP